MVTLTKDSNCLRCGKNSMLTDDVTGEQFCSKCGYVVSEKSNESGPEWRSFQTESGTNPARTGAPSSLLMHDMGLSTVINPVNKDATGKPLSSSMKSTIERLRTWDSRSQSHEPMDRNLRQALNELSRMKDKIALSSNVLEKAAYLYRKALEKKLVRGRSISAMIAASLYAACRDTETPRTLNDIADAANVKRKDIARCYRLLHHELELKMPVVNSIQCISRISSKLELSEKTKRYAIKVLQEAQDNKESAGKDPMGLAATALYVSCIKNGDSITQRNLAEAAGVTEVTIRNRFKGLKNQQNTTLDFMNKK
ncbi:MAG: transcription initiation factor IIB [Nitrosopumilus sp.]|nr:transcription initiation factor IIB [Nitrosopumilus sp.]MCE2505420.1 transcription initiation factor IIB [Nitrosopumilaceae archaeon]